MGCLASMVVTHWYGGVLFVYQIVLLSADGANHRRVQEYFLSSYVWSNKQRFDAMDFFFFIKYIYIVAHEQNQASWTYWYLSPNEKIYTHKGRTKKKKKLLQEYSCRTKKDEKNWSKNWSRMPCLFVAHAGRGTGPASAGEIVTDRSSSSELDSPRKCERMVLAEACPWWDTMTINTQNEVPSSKWF